MQMAMIATAPVKKEEVKPFLTTLTNMKSATDEIDFRHLYVLCLSVAGEFVYKKDAFFAGVLR